MKQLMNILAKDIQVENFSRKECVVYGVVAPAALIVICMVASIF